MGKENIEEPYALLKCGYFYRHNSCGYTSSILEAELFTEKYAKRQEAHCDELRAVPLSEVLTADKMDEYARRIDAMREFFEQTRED